MGELLDITPTGENHPTRAVTVGEAVRPAWTLDVDAPTSEVTFNFIGGAEVGGDDLEKTELGGGEYEYRPKKANAPKCVSTYQLVKLSWDGPGDRGTVDSAVIHAEPTIGD